MVKTRKRDWISIVFGMAVIYFVYLLHGIMMPFITALIVAYLLNPLVYKLQQHRIRRSIGSSLLIITFFISFGSALFVAIPFLKNELLKLAVRMPGYINSFKGFVDPYIAHIQNSFQVKELMNFDTTVSNYLGDMVSWILNLTAGFFSNTLALANLISLIILTPVISFYLLRDWPKFISTLDGLLPYRQAPRIRHLILQINNILAGYLRGQALVCLSLAIYYMIGLSLVGLDFSLTVGLITGILAFIPYFGYLVGVTAGISIAVGQFTEWYSVWLVAGVFVNGQILETYYLLPKLVGDRIGLHPIWIIFALLAGGLLFGFNGVLFAMPVAAMSGVLVRFVVHEYRRSEFFIQKKSVNPAGQPQIDKVNVD